MATMTDQVLEALEKTGMASPETLTRKRAEQEAIAAVKAQRFVAAKEASEIMRIKAESDTAEADATVARVREVDGEHARARRELDAVIASETALPTKQATEIDSAYAARLSKASIEETRRLRAAQLAGMDASVIAGSTDAAEIAGVIERALTSGDAEVAGRLLTLGERRLRELAVREARTTSHAPGTAPIAAALAQVQIPAAAWRREHEARLPETRRARLDDHFARRRREIIQNAERVAEYSGGLAELKLALGRYDGERRNG